MTDQLDRITFFELPDGKIVCCGGRWHGWLLHKHPDGYFVSEQKLREIERPRSPLEAIT